MSFFDTQNPGIGGLDELTDAETIVVQNLGSLGDPNADRILFWDDSAGGFRYLTAGTGLTITNTTIDATGAGLTIGTTTITSGSNGRVLYDNNGVLGEMTTTGSGTVLALATSPVLVTPTLGVAAATSLTVTTGLNPATNDASPLGTSSLKWSDLFLASGAVIDFNGGNAVITHSNNVLTLTTGDLKVVAAGTTATSVTVNDATQTLNTKRINPRIVSTASSATPTPDVSSTDEYILTALAAGATFGIPAGTPLQGQKLIIRIKDNASSQTLAYNAIYRAVGVTLPTATVISKTLYLGMIYNFTDTRWDVVAVAQEA